MIDHPNHRTRTKPKGRASHDISSFAVENPEEVVVDEGAQDCHREVLPETQGVEAGTQTNKIGLQLLLRLLQLLLESTCPISRVHTNVFESSIVVDFLIGCHAVSDCLFTRHGGGLLGVDVFDAD